MVSRPANFGVIESTFTHIRLIMGRLLMNGNIHIHTVTNTSIFLQNNFLRYPLSPPCKIKNSGSNSGLKVLEASVKVVCLVEVNFIFKS